MKKYRYVKSNAFTSGESLGNPAACIFTGQEKLTPDVKALLLTYLYFFIVA